VSIELLPPIQQSEATTRRPISPGAERWLGVPIRCLDHGFVYLVDYLGNDEAIVQAARVSYGTGTKKVSEDRGLVRYLRRHLHTTPSEMVELKFHVKLPIFVARQWIRHRTANVNEYSGRYSVLDDEFYLPAPETLRKQSQTNRQGGSDETLSPEQADQVQSLLRDAYAAAYRGYSEMLDLDLARELARIGLSVANYTQWYWKIDLHNLFHFLMLRMDSHAQHEIAVYGHAMAQIVKDAFPWSWEAFEDYQLEAQRLTRPERAVIQQLLGQRVQASDEEILAACDAIGLTNTRERTELLEKMRAIGFLQ